MGAVALEFDLTSGRRGGRFSAIERYLPRSVRRGRRSCCEQQRSRSLAGVERSSRRKGGGGVARGQLVEIGGEFRVPDIVVQGGAVLREVGTTNRTHAFDYRSVMGAETAVLLEVHPSNFEVVGFVESVTTSDLAKVAHAAGAVVVADLGSGLIDDKCPWLNKRPDWLAHEPGARQALEFGADIVTFSGDKLLGGPQAGIICGRADLIGRMRHHPLARTIRFDKTRAMHLQSVLETYLDGTAGSAVPSGRWQPHLPIRYRSGQVQSPRQSTPPQAPDLLPPS
ncbi:MAG: hypothetical protein U5K30_16615 [Acidimicrobiales bacterium]|nr:hypothetical protein [Acidimicrobiales bacterium]